MRPGVFVKMERQTAFGAVAADSAFNAGRRLGRQRFEVELVKRDLRHEAQDSTRGRPKATTRKRFAESRFGLTECECRE
jgi:hypothetical protein